MAEAIFAEGAAPSTPAASKVTLYAKTDGLLYSKDDVGTETLVSSGTGGGVTDSSDASITISGTDAIVNANWLNGFALINGYLVTSVAASALTIAIKNAAGSDPSSTNPVKIVFRNATAGTGDFTVITLTAATSLVISSGSTMGFTSAKASRLWLVGFNDAGTFRIGAVNCLSGTNIYPLRDDILASSTTEGGAGGADSAHVIYTGTGVTSKAMRILGYIEWSSGLTTAGTWDAVPTKIQLFGPGVALPGTTIQTKTDELLTVSTGTTVIPFDDTIPQNTEGTQFFSQAITPTSSANILDLVCCYFGCISAAESFACAYFQDSTANALFATTSTIPSADYAGTAMHSFQMLAGTVSETTFNVRIGPGTSGTVTINGQSAGRKYGGVSRAYFTVRELMA